MKAMDTSCYSEIDDSLMLSFESNESSPKSDGLHTRPEIAAQVHKHVLNAVNHKHSSNSLESSIRIANEAPGAKFQLPATKYKIRKIIEPVFEHEYYYECERCEEYTTVPRIRQSERTIDCDYCGSTIQKKSKNFFILIPLKQQLQESLEKNWISISSYQHSRTDNSFISDVKDGSIC